jgi:hypothetical protein
MDCRGASHVNLIFDQPRFLPPISIPFE